MKKIYSYGLMVIVMTVLLLGPKESVQAADKTYEGILSYQIKDGICVITGCNKSTVGTLIIPEKIDGFIVAKVEKGAFDNCTELEAVVFRHAPILSANMFSDCTVLKTVVMNFSPESECEYYYNYDFTGIEKTSFFAGDGKFKVYVVDNDYMPKSMYIYEECFLKYAEMATVDGLNIFQLADSLEETGVDLEAKARVAASNSKNVADFTISLSKTSYTYSGKKIEPVVTVQNGNKTLKKETDYTVSYQNNKAMGKATVTIKGKGKYTGSSKVVFKILPQKTSIVSAESTKEGQALITWKKQSGVSGYEIYYALSKDGDYYLFNEVSGSGTVKYEATDMPYGTSYYIKVRAYKTVSNGKYTGAFSGVKSVIIKGENKGWNGVYSNGSMKIIMIDKGERICVVDSSNQNFFITTMEEERNDREIHSSVSDGSINYAASYDFSLSGDTVHFIHTYFTGSEYIEVTNDSFTRTGEEPYQLYQSYR